MRSFSGTITLVKDGLYAWITDALAERGWKDAELGRRAHLSSATMSMVMSGQRSATAEFCIAIAEALDADVLMVLRLGGHVRASIADVRKADAPLDHACNQLMRLRARDTGDFMAAVKMIDGLLQEEGRLQLAPQMGPPEASGGILFSRDETSELIRFIADRAAQSGMEDVILHILKEHEERAAARERERESRERL